MVSVEEEFENVIAALFSRKHNMPHLPCRSADKYLLELISRHEVISKNRSTNFLAT